MCTVATATCAAGSVEAGFRRLAVGQAPSSHSHNSATENRDTGSTGAHTHCGCGAAAAAADAEDELQEHEWRAACGEATAVIQAAVDGINEELQEIRYEVAELEGTPC